MENGGVKTNRTLIQSFERLESNCRELEETTELCKTLSKKLNRTEHEIILSKTQEPYKEEDNHKNIVDLFNLISDKLEKEIESINYSIRSSIDMID